MHVENSLTFIPGKVFSISQLVRVTALSQLGKLVPLLLDLPVLQVAHFILWGQVSSQVWAGHCESESPQGQQHTAVAETLQWPWVRIKSVLASDRGWFSFTVKGQRFPSSSQGEVRAVSCRRLLRERWQGADPALPNDKSFPTWSTGTHRRRDRKCHRSRLAVTSDYGAMKLHFSSKTAEPHILNKEQQASRNSKAADICLFSKYS